MKYWDEQTQSWKDIQIKVANAIKDEYGTSQSDGYSQKYLNDKIVNVGTSVNSANRVNVLYSKNLFDLSNIVSGKGLSADNSTYDSASRSYLDYTEVKENTTYMISDLTWEVLIFLNSNKQVISSKNSDNDTPPFTTPANCKYIRISFDNTVSWQSGKIQEGTTTFVPSIVVDNDTIYEEAVVQGTCTLGNEYDYDNIAYPSGFDKDNCIIAGYVIKSSSASVWETGMNTNIELLNGVIGIVARDYPTGATINYKICLKKI